MSRQRSLCTILDRRPDRSSTIGVDVAVFSMGADCTLGLDVCARLSLDGTGAGCTLMMDAL